MKAAAYARYSTDHQTENSIAYQMEAIDRYCAEHKIDIVARYSDEAKSGTNTDREDFQAMLKAAADRVFDAVIIYDISRGSRDVADWFQFRKQMAALGIQVIAVSGQLGDVLNPNDFLVEGINVMLGQHMVLDTRKKSMAAVDVKAKQGVFLGGYPPYGYTIVNQQYVINEAEAKHVRLMFKMYADGASYKEIIEKLKDEHIITRHGVPIGKSTLYSILTNERYIGTYIWCEHINRVMRKWAGKKPSDRCVKIEDAIPAIIDKTTWERVKVRMSDNKRRARNKAKQNYLLSGLIECEACGSTYVGHCSTNTKGVKTRYYVCGNKYRTRSCKAKNINADMIEAFVIIQLREYLRTVNVEEIAKTIADQINGASPDLHAEKKELLEIKTKLQNGTNAILSGLDLPELREEMDRLRVRKSELEDIIAEAQKGDAPIDPKEIVELFRIAEEQLDKNPRAAVETLVTKIYAHTDGSYTVNIGVHINGSPSWTRTNDTAVNSRVLYRLSYGGIYRLIQSQCN